MLVTTCLFHNSVLKLLEISREEEFLKIPIPKPDALN